MSFPLLFTTGNFSILYFCRIFSAFLKSVPSGAVMRFSLVITSRTFLLGLRSNRRSRLVRMPTSLFFASTMGMPPILFSFINRNASPMVASSRRVTGSRIRPLSERFTLRTCSTWRSIDIFLCSIPTPPCLARAMANEASVTVSMAADMNGIFSVMFLVRRELMLTSRGSTCEYAGTSSTSSNVKPSPKNLLGNLSLGELMFLAMCKDTARPIYEANFALAPSGSAGISCPATGSISGLTQAQSRLQKTCCTADRKGPSADRYA